MLTFLRTRFAQGTRTTAFPDQAPEFPERFRGRPVLDSSCCPEGCRECAERSPTSLIRIDANGRAMLDLGACQFSPEEVTTCPHGAVRYTRDHRLATSRRDDLVTPTGELELAHALEQQTRRLFGRSLRLRSVVAGSCNGCEA
jgi:formate hydrogenlyase subunit 6/NADH:ubiquinone oxidoreductase subunit I